MKMGSTTTSARTNNPNDSSTENTQSASNHMAQYHKKTYIALDPSLFDPSQKQTSQTISRSQIPLENNLLLILENFLTDAQSNYLVESIEALSFQSISWEYPPDYRSCKRKIAFSDDLAFFLWQRVVRCFEWEDLQFISPFGFEKESRWLAHKVNPCFRFTKYQKGDFFKKHLDGGHVQTEDDRSVLTLMIYLNDEFSGGDTIFYENAAAHVIKPRKNAALIFNHDIEHEGKQLEDGFKYVLRTDIMFKRYRIDFDYGNHLRQPGALVAKQLKPVINDKSKSAEKIEEERQQSEKLFYESVDLQRQGNPRVSTEKYLEAQRILSQYPTYLKKKLQKIKDENFPNNKDFNRLATPFYLESIFKYLFSFDLLEDTDIIKPEPQYVDSYTLEKDKWVSSKTLNKEKLDEILKLRLVSRKMNKFASGNFLWAKFLEKNFPKNLLAFRNLEMPNDNHYLEIFKLKSYEFKKNVKVFIDISCDYFRLAFNQAVVEKGCDFYCEKLPFNAYNGKLENVVNYYQGHLWGSRSGFNFTLGELKNEDFEYFSNWVCGSTYENGSEIHKRLINVLSYISNVNNTINFSFSLPFYFFTDFEISNEKYVECIKFEDNRLKDFKQVLKAKDPNAGEAGEYRNLPQGYFSGQPIFWSIDYAIQNKNTKTKEFKDSLKEENDLRKKIYEKLTSLDDLPNQLLANYINQNNYLLYDYLENCVCRERLFFKSLDKSTGIVVFFDGGISTFAYFRENQIKRDYCFSFKEQNIKSKQEGVSNEFLKKLNAIYNEISIEYEANKDKNALVHIDAIIVYEKEANEKFVDEVKERIKDKIRVETVYYKYDEILTLEREFL